MPHVFELVNNSQIGMDKSRRIVLNGVPNININVISIKNMIYVFLSSIIKERSPLIGIPDFLSLPLVGRT